MPKVFHFGPRSDSEVPSTRGVWLASRVLSQIDENCFYATVQIVFFG
jgi:hypothetical protein